MPPTNPCDRQPDKKRNIDGGVSVHIYLDVPDADAAPLILCRRSDKDYWNDDISPGSGPKVCTVLIYYKKGS